MKRTDDRDYWVMVAGVVVILVSILAGSPWGMMFGFALAASRVL